MRREAFEEVGIADLAIIAGQGLAADVRAGEAHHRHCFHLRAATPLPPTWQPDEREPSHGDPPILFGFCWLPRSDAPTALIAEMGALRGLKRA